MDTPAKAHDRDVELVEIVAPVSRADAEFAALCLRELFAPIADRAEDLRAYLDTELRAGATTLLAIELAGQRAGLVSLVRFAMPRYLGHGYEIQELVILEPFRGRGVARRALTLVAERCRQDPLARKVVVRTNVPAARAAYGAVWQESDMASYQAMLNLLAPPPRDAS